MYDEYEDDYLDAMTKKPAIEFVSLGNFKEENEDPKINVSPYFSNSEISRWGEVFCLLDLVGENGCVFVETCTKDEALNSESLSEGHDVSFKNCHEYSLHSSFEGQFECGQEELLLE